MNNRVYERITEKADYPKQRKAKLDPPPRKRKCACQGYLQVNPFLIIDRSEMRSGESTVHVKWDKNTVLLAGGALNNLAYLSLVKNNVDKNVIPKIVEIIAETSLELADGEMMNVGFEKRIDVTENEYFEMIKKKQGL